MRSVWSGILGVLATGMVGPLGAQEPARPGVSERLARKFSSEVREAAPRLDRLAEELEKLPALIPGNLGSHYGFHSGTILDQEEAHSVLLDLGKTCCIDCIVAMPAHVPTIETSGVGYGFPLRFKIEVADKPGMRDAVRVVDRTAADVKNPGRYPMVFRFEEIEGRYVRFTSTRHPASAEGFSWAMEELMVLSGNRNVAVGCNTSATSQLDLLPSWSVGQINDGFSALGMPTTADPSPTNGYLSVTSDQARTEKWLVVDLGEEFPIDEIRLLPAGSEKNVSPRGFPRIGGRPLPRHLTVELSIDAAFEKIPWRLEISSKPRAYPWGNPVVMQTGGRSGRYIRILTRELWARGKAAHNFALSEVQAYAGNRNVALGKPVQAKDALDRAVDRRGSPRWAPEFLVDGFTSRHPLVELPEYLELIEQRAALEREQAMLRSLRDRKVRQVSNTLSAAGGGLGVAALLGWVWMLVRQRVVRRRDVSRLREQIARDLHDDIGSNLGGIVLLSEMGSRHRGSDSETRSDFAAIKTAAEETTESMQDIVWLIQPGRPGLRELLVKLRKTVEMIVGALVVSVVVDPPEFRDRRLSLLFRRHWFFAFKEALNNVRKHAAASHVGVKIEVSPTHLAFTVRDDGKGFDPRAAAETGHGLGNLQRRAERLNGTCRLESEPGHGTCVYFRAPLKA